MSANPAFASIPRLGFGSISTANTNFDGTGTIVDLLTGVTAGTRIERITIVATVDPADSMVNIFLHDGTSYRYFDSFDLGNPASGSTTVPPYREERPYQDLVLPSSSWKIAASITVALTSGVINAFVHGADLT
jgi:hypothetical protein